MQTLKRTIIILALLIPFFPLPLPSGERIEVRGEFPLNKGGLRGLLLPSPAEAYTYQDVENEYEKAKTQYPSNKIWIEQVSGGYRIWKRPLGILFKRKWYFESVAYISTGNWAAYLDACDGISNSVYTYFHAGDVVYGCCSPPAIAYYIAKTCDGSVTDKVSSWPYNSIYSLSSPCNYSSETYNNCSSLDVMLAEFIPVDLCLDKTTGNYVPCLKNCQDPTVETPAVEICGNGIDDNCNGEIDEGCRQCTDNDGDGYYAYDSVSCPEGNDCNDNDPAINPSTIWYKDSDGDGYSDGTTISACLRPAGYKLASELKSTLVDCDDTDASKTPEDIDGDGYSTCTGDCNDTDKTIKPGAKEECDKKDNNCNKDVDEGACDCSVELRLNSSANAANGSLSHNQELFSSKGTGLSVSMTLYYNSLYSGSGHLGTGWTHSYNTILKEFSDGSILFREGNDRKLYTLSGGNYVNQSDDYSTLVKNLDGTYLITKKDGIKYNFDQGGKIVSIVDRLGNTMTFTYTGGDPSTGSGQALTEITDSVGRKTILSYDSSNRITQIQAPSPLVGEGGGEGKTSTFTYNLAGYLIAVTDSAGYSWTYTYDANGRMLTKSDTEGNVITYTYDLQGRVLSSADSAGTKSISYSSPPVGEGGVRGTATVTEKDGGVWTYTYDSANGTLTQKTDPIGNTTTYQYDNSRNLIKETVPDGSTTTYTYDTQGNMTGQTDASGNTTTYTYNTYGQVTSITDSQSNVTHYSYDVYGNMTSVTDLSGGITQFNYDAKGNITRTTNPNGGVTVYEYDSYNNITKITDPSGASTIFTYDTAGNMTSMTDSSGNTTRFEYNSLNQLIRVIDQNGNVTEYSFDSKGNKTSQTDANGNTTYYEYNHNSKLTKVTDALGNVTTYTYGGTGGCPSCGSGGGDNLTSITDGKGQITTYQYDSLGRLTKETDPLGNVIAYSYDSKGNLISKVDANGNVINYTYDSLGRLLKKTYPDATTETFTYDSKGNILSAMNQNISYTFTYDASGKPLSVTDSYGRTISYQYDVSGNKTNMTTPEGKIIKYNYDSIHRLTQIQTPSPLVGEGGGEGASSTSTFAFTYDSLGRRTKLTYPNGVTTNYSYDSIGRLTNLLTQYTEIKEQGKKKPPILKLHAIDSFTYTHDKVGNRLIKTEISDTHTDTDTKYSYDAIYRLLQSMPSKIRHNDKEKEFEHRAETFTYDPVGNRLTGPKNKLNYTYNQGNQLTELTKFPLNKGGEGVVSPPLEGGDGGVVEKKTEYTYDKNGNLTKKVELDDEGNIKKTTLYTYDFENRLIRVEVQRDAREKIVEFTYDPFGRRLSKSVSHLSLRGEAEAISDDNDDDDDDDDNGEDDSDDNEHHTPRATYYVYDNEDIIMEYNHKGKVTARYVHGLGIDEPLAVALTLPLLTKEGSKGRSAVYYYHADGLGSITALTDAKGKVVQRYDYDSFGNLKHYGHKVKQPYTYTAREYDRETGLYYYRARYYDANVGRFIGKDPILNPLNPMTIGLSRSANLIVWMTPYLISSPKGLHPYVYVGNVPTMYTDSTGLLGWDTVIKQVLKQLAKKLLKEGLGDPLEKGAETERQALEQFYFEQYKRCLEGCGGEGRCDTEECKGKCSEQYARDIERLQRSFR